MQEFKVTMTTYCPMEVDYMTVVGQELEDKIQELIANNSVRIDSKTSSIENNVKVDIVDVRFSSTEHFQAFETIIRNNEFVQQRQLIFFEYGILRTLDPVGLIDTEA